ncbi:hypothetical protein [uncultured Gelidibacter sp.]|uniref:HYC_CC_PP family protein n=1 Tax=uncultured Gelidibacter sp. TaxID=259318 RepID=UPI0026223335|nr:hypothetical protein [uncultured Gelidibacter sp.]
MNAIFRNFAAMNQKISHKIFSGLLAVLVLLSTVSFTMEKHFCGEVLIDVAIFSHPDSCGTAMSDASNTIEKHCCKDVVEILKGQDQLKKTSFEEFSFDQQVFLSALFYSFTNLFEGLPHQVIPHKDYSPPHLVADIHVRDQVFII